MTIISGTDPTNPRTPGDIVERLEQIARDAEAMAAEARRLYMFARIVPKVLTDDDLSDDVVRVVAQHLASRCRRAAEWLETGSEQARRAAGEVRDSGVNLSTRFRWRPVRRLDD